MLVHRLDEILARTDPFDLAQAIERHTSTLSLAQIRGLIADARPRLNSYYADEFAQVQAIGDPVLAQAAFARALTSNLRVVPLFGASFSNSVLARAPAERAVGIGEETSPRAGRRIAFGVVAALLLAVIGYGVRFVSDARSQAVTPTPVPLAAVSVQPILVVRRQTPRAHRRRPAVPRRIVARLAAPQPRPETATAVAPTVWTAPPPVPPTTRSQRPIHARLKPPIGQGVATVVVTPPTPAPQAAAMDTSDTPQSYTDATPLPEQTAPPVIAPRSVRVATPVPQPKRKSWFHRAIMHLDPFKPNPRVTP